MATVLITGANRGVGLELARCFSQRGDLVFGTSRNTDVAEAGLFARVLKLDVRSEASIAMLEERLVGLHIDILINKMYNWATKQKPRSIKNMEYEVTKNMYTEWEMGCGVCRLIECIIFAGVNIY